jgi:Zn-dependent protease
MRDPFSWSFSVGRVFGVVVRIHILFPLICLGLILRQVFKEGTHPGTWIDATIIMVLLFFIVLLHELGHCFMARRVGGEANEVLLWPLGGLAAVDVPHSARANFLTAAGGPLVNLLICFGCALALIFALDESWRPPLSFLWIPYSSPEPDKPLQLGEIAIQHMSGKMVWMPRYSLPVMLSQIFWLSWLGLLLNVLLIGYPLDGGRMFQCILWRYVGYRQATLYAIYAGFCSMFLILFVVFVWNEVMLLMLAFFIYTSCTQQWLMLDHGSEDSLFGYDFSQGYTSLEKDRPAPPRRKQPNFFQRWLQRRAARKLLAEQQRQLEEENRMDQLLEKIQRFGKDSLTEEEHRFLKKVADRYRNRP